MAFDKYSKYDLSTTFSVKSLHIYRLCYTRVGQETSLCNMWNGKDIAIIFVVLLTFYFFLAVNTTFDIRKAKIII